MEMNGALFIINECIRDWVCMWVWVCCMTVYVCVCEYELCEFEYVCVSVRVCVVGVGSTWWNLGDKIKIHSPVFFFIDLCPK